MMNEIKLLKELNLKMHNRLREIEGEIQLLLTNLLVTLLEIVQFYCKSLMHALSNDFTYWDIFQKLKSKFFILLFHYLYIIVLSSLGSKNASLYHQDTVILDANVDLNDTISEKVS